MTTDAPARPRRRTLTRVAALPAFVAALIGVAALAWLAEIAAPPPPLPDAADGIVVLTGGADRLATALRLLAEGRGPALLVSGVGGSAALADLVRGAGTDPGRLEPGWRSRVTLGRAATSTYGNAIETARWARAANMRSLIVVTAYYHMPRALTELGRALPEVRLYPVSVRPAAARGAAEWRLLADEYAKWLVAKAGLSRYATLHDPPQAAARLAGRAPERLANAVGSLWTNLWNRPAERSRGSRG